MASGNSTIGRKNPYQVFCPFASPPKKMAIKTGKSLKSPQWSIGSIFGVGTQAPTKGKDSHMFLKKIRLNHPAASATYRLNQPTVPTVRGSTRTFPSEARKFGWDPNKAALPGRRKAEESWTVKMRAGMISHQAPKLVHKIWIYIPPQKNDINI